MHHEESRYMCGGEGEGGQGGSVDEEAHGDMCGCEREGARGGSMDKSEYHDDMCGGE